MHYTYIYKYTHTIYHIGPSLVAQMVKNLPAMREFYPWVWKIPLEKGTHSLLYSCLRNPMDEGVW